MGRFFESAWFTAAYAACLGIVAISVGCGGESAGERAGLRFEGTEPSDCTDDADNDADGLFDCDDPGCSGSAACAAGGTGGGGGNGGSGGAAGVGGTGTGGAGGFGLCGSGETCNGVVQGVPVYPQQALDLLFVIDDSPSMRDEQEKLIDQVPRLVRLLLTGGEDTNGSKPLGDFPEVKSLHVGVITPDLGHSTVPVHNFTAGSGMSFDFNPSSACMRNNGMGEAGLMQVGGLSGTPRVPCAATTPPEGTPYLNYPESGFDENDLVSDVQCVTGQDDGCGFEQTLESILAADRNGANAGFNRENALLAVILITDEDDCSTADPRVFDVEARGSNPFQGPFTSMTELQFNLRCWAHSQALQRIQRYVDGVAALKSDPSQVVFAAIAGIPEDSSLDRENFGSDEARYDAILASGAMTEVPDPAMDDTQEQQLRPACIATDGSGAAAPARRIVETVKGLAESNAGVGTVVESICAADYAPALNAIVDRIAGALRQVCLPRLLNRNSSGVVGCEVREVQPEGLSCADAESRGREPVAVAMEDGREVCRVTQLRSDAGVPTGMGWFYDDFTAETTAACSFNPERQRVSFTEGAAPVSGARARLECLQAAPPVTQDIGWPCTANSQCIAAECAAHPSPSECMKGVLEARYDRDNLELSCDPASNTCQLACESDYYCPGGFACADVCGDGNKFCVNPTCAPN